MPLQILVINENESFCDYLSELLAKGGHEVFCVQGLEKLLQTAASLKPGVIILEIAADDVGAVQMVDRLQRAPETRQVPVIVICEMPELEFELLNLFDFLPHPLDTTRLNQDLRAIAKGAKQSQPPHTDTLSDEVYHLFLEYLLKESGLHFERRNLKLLERGLLNRMSALKISSFADYYQYLQLYQESRQELKKLLPFLTIGETYFFRYHAHFAALRSIIAQEKAKLKPGEKLSLRLWSAGCSTGEEPYSLAMTVMDAVPDWQQMDIKILATDIDNRALKRAKEGIYGPWAMRVIEKGQLDRYFEKSGKKYRINEDVKRLVEFSHHNLLTSAAPEAEGHPGLFDAIFCRNVTIYFTIATTKVVIGKLTACLKPHGYLFLGHAETLSHISSHFERQCFDGGFYYRKKEIKVVAPALNSATGTMPPRQDQRLPVTALKPVPAGPEPPAFSTPDPGKGFIEATALFNQESFREAASLLEEILQHHPRHAGALVLLGFTKANDGRFDEALAACEQALKINDLLPEAYFLKGLILEMTERLLEAVDEYRKAILLEQEFLMPHYQLSQVYGRLGKEKERLRELKLTLNILNRMNGHDIIPHSGGMSSELLLSQLKKEWAQVGMRP